MGIKGIFKFLLHRIFEFTLVILLIVLLPNLPPYTNFSESYRVTPFEGKLELKETLNDAEILHKGDLVGPEAFADYNGELYVSLYGGDIVKLIGNHITPVVKFGKPCKGPYEEKICGRPLGIEFDKSGTLYAADAYYGIFKVDVKTGQKVQLVSPNEEINGKKAKLFNSVALASNGDIFWSDSTSEFTLEDGLFSMLADPSGRLIHYDTKTRKNKVLIDKIAFANGVILSDDEEFVLVLETNRNRIQRYYLKGPKQGRRDIFIDGLPGLPDNIKSDGQGNFIVPLIKPIDTDHPNPLQMISPFPLIRKFFARIMGLTQLLFQTVDRYYPNEFSQKAVHFIGSFTSFTSVDSWFTPKRTTILRINKNGEILDSLHNLNNKIRNICEGYIFKDTLYLGSPFNDYLARIPLSKIGWSFLQVDRKRREVPQESVKQASPTKIPTTIPPTEPLNQETIPLKQTVPPKPTVTPSKSENIPKQVPLSDQLKVPSPKQETPTKSPTLTQQKPQKQEEPLKQQTASSKPQTQSPSPQTPPPKTQTPPPKAQTPPPKTQTPPPKTQTPPPKTQTPPPKQQTPPPQQQTPLPQQQTLPPKQETPPPKQQTPHPTQAPSPQQQNLPKQQSSQRQQDPPSLKPETLPPKQAPPPTQQTKQVPLPTQQTKQVPPPTKQTKQVPPPKEVPPTQSPPPVKEPVKSQTKDFTTGK